MSNILLLETSSLFSHSLQNILITSLEHPVQVSIVTTLEETLQHLNSDVYDALIIGTKAISNEPDGIRKIKEEYEDLNILMINNSLEPESIKKFYKLGVIGIVDAKCSVEEFITAVKSILNGFVHLDKQTLMYLLNPATNESNIYKLTKREVEISDLLYKGYKNITICAELGLKESTVSTLKRRIFKKLQVTNNGDFYKMISKTG